MSDQRHRIQVDYSERQAPLLELLRQSGAFDARIVRLTVGDYLINDEVLIERKTIADFSASLVDGRLFPQAARLARDGHRTLMLIEGPRAASMPDVHPHAVQGALVSLAAMWRLPVLHTCDAADSFRVMQFLAAQASGCRERMLRRYDRKPKRLASRRLFLLQGWPGVGPAIAARLLNQLGSIRGVVTADIEILQQVAASGQRKRRGFWNSSAERCGPSAIVRISPPKHARSAPEGRSVRRVCFGADLMSSRTRKMDRMGALPPRYSFFLNPHPNERYTRCPRCKATTRARKIPLVIHVDSVGLVLLRKTCRLCVVCEMLIAHEAEVNRVIEGLAPYAANPATIVVGTLGSVTWLGGLSGSVTMKRSEGHGRLQGVHARRDHAAALGLEGQP